MNWASLPKIQPISSLIGFRYQHVRNVLLRSGIEGGLRGQVEVEREPVTVDAAPPPREDTSWKVLTDAGFQLLGEWTHDPESLIKLDAKAPSAPGVHAFVVDDVVVYVGLTLSGLQDTAGPVPQGPQRPEDQLPDQRPHLGNLARRKTGEGPRSDARAARMAGSSR
jgi:hypothetical protein